MKTPALATVYLDNEAIGLMGDPKPLVSKIAAAGGKDAAAVQIRRAKSATDTHGKPLNLSDVIDRTSEPAVPIYLTTTPKPATPHASSGPGARRQSGPGGVTPEWRSWPTFDDPEPETGSPSDPPATTPKSSGGDSERSSPASARKRPWDR